MGEMDIQDLRIFARVAAVQNLSAVGAELDVTPGTISKRLQALEDELRVKLFDRTTRSIRITAEGAKFLEHTNRILVEVDAARAAVSEHIDQPAGRLKIAAPTSLARQLVAPALSSFIATYPEIDLRVDLTDRPVNIMEEAYDAVIVSGQLADSTLIARRLAPDRHIIVASPAYVAKHGAPSTPSEIDQRDCLVMGQSRTWVFRRNGAEETIRVAGRLQSDDADLLRWAAVEGSGILRVSAHNAVTDVAEGRLIVLLPDYEVVTKSAIWIVYSNSRHVLPRLRALLDHMANWARENLPVDEAEKSSLFAAK